MYTCTYKYSHICTHAHGLHTYTHIYTQAHTSLFIHIHMHISAHGRPCFSSGCDTTSLTSFLMILIFLGKGGWGANLLPKCSAVRPTAACEGRNGSLIRRSLGEVHICRTLSLWGMEKGQQEGIKCLPHSKTQFSSDCSLWIMNQGIKALNLLKKQY